VTEWQLSFDHRLRELHQVAEELRAARLHRVDHPGVVARLRLVVGRGFLAVATALLADPARPGLASR
jgi:hypothetical protein